MKKFLWSYKKIYIIKFVVYNYIEKKEEFKNYVHRCLISIFIKNNFVITYRCKSFWLLGNIIGNTPKIIFCLNSCIEILESCFFLMFLVQLLACSIQFCLQGYFFVLVSEYWRYSFFLYWDKDIFHLHDETNFFISNPTQLSFDKLFENGCAYTTLKNI